MRSTRRTAGIILEAMADCDTGICGADVPPLVGSTLTGTGLTVEQAARLIAQGEEPPLLTDVQRRIVERWMTERASAF